MTESSKPELQSAECRMQKEDGEDDDENRMLCKDERVCIKVQWQ